MERVGYTKSGIKETCRHDYSHGGTCKRHVRHLESSANNVAIMKKIVDSVTVDTGSYKITHEGLYALNCSTCSGKGVNRFGVCSECSGQGWDTKGQHFDSLSDFKNYYTASATRTLSTYNQQSSDLFDTGAGEEKFLPYMLGDLVRVSGEVSTIKNLKTVYGATIMIMLTTLKGEKVVFFSKNKWVLKLSKGSKVTVRGYVKDFKTYDGVNQTVLRQVSLV